MNFIHRGLKNIYRKKARTLVIILVLALSISIFVTMAAIDESVGKKLVDVQSSVGTQLELRPAGVYGLSHSRSSNDEGAYLSDEIINKVQNLEHVVSAKGYLSTMGDFAEEHVMVIGVEPNAKLAIFGGTTGRIISGDSLNSYDNNDLVVLVGKGYTEKHDVKIGDTVKLKDTDVKVVGIFTSDTSYGDHGIITPLGAMQDIFNFTGQVSSVFVDVGSIKNVDSVTQQIKEATANDEVDIIDKDKDSREPVIASLGNIQTTSGIGATLALIIGSIIVFFTMLLVTRERKKEIGTLKAIGASNGDIIKQFIVETTTIAIVAAVIGLVLVSVGGSAVASAIFAQSDTASQMVTEGGFSSYGEMMQAHHSGGGGSRTGEGYMGSSDISNMSSPITFNFSLNSILYAFGIAILLSLVGMLYPAIWILKMNPAEALKYE